MRKKSRKNSHHAAHKHVKIYDFPQFIRRNTVKHPLPEKRANNHASNSEKPSLANSRSQEAVPRPENSHHKISDQKIELRHRHVAILVLFRSHEIKHRRRPLHSEKPAQHAAQSTRRELDRKSVV